MNFNQEYFRHIKQHHTYSNYKKEKAAVREMLDDFMQLSHYEKHEQLEYFRHRPEFQHFSRYFQFSGLLHPRHSLTSLLEVLLHLHHQSHLDHQSVIFHPPDIHPQVKIDSPFAAFLDSLHAKYDLESLVEQEIEREVFHPSNVDVLFNKLEGSQPKGTPTSPPLQGISDADRAAFDKHFQDYISKLAYSKDWGHKQQDHDRARARVEQQRQGRRVKGIQEEQRDLAQDIINHHTAVQVDPKDYHQVDQVARQIIHLAIQSDHNYTHLHQFQQKDGKVVMLQHHQINNTQQQQQHNNTQQQQPSSFILLDERFSYQPQAPDIQDEQEKHTDIDAKPKISQNIPEQDIIYDDETTVIENKQQTQKQEQKEQLQTQKEQKELEQTNDFKDTNEKIIDLMDLQLTDKDFDKDLILQEIENDKIKIQEKKQREKQLQKEREERKLKKIKQEEERLDDRFSFKEKEDEDDEEEEDSQDEKDQEKQDSKDIDEENEEKEKAQKEKDEEEGKVEKKEEDMTEQEKKEKEQKKKKKEDQKRCKLKNKKAARKKKDKLAKQMAQMKFPPDIITPLIMFPIKVPMAIIKGIILFILVIIGTIMHICMTLGPFAITTCPEASPSFTNLYTVFQFEEKDLIFNKQVEGFMPMYIQIKKRNMSYLYLKFVVTTVEIVKYYICAIAFFTTTCSQIWSGCDLLAFLFTNPPILVMPFTAALPPLHYTNIIPGEKPFCFFSCIYALIACFGMHWQELTICKGLFNIDNLVRMLFDIALLLFTIFSFVPGFCDFWPWIINIWKLPFLQLSSPAQIHKAQQPAPEQPNCTDSEFNLTLDNSSEPFKPDYQVPFKAPQTFPYDVMDVEQEWEAQDWEINQMPNNFTDAGFTQYLDKKKDEKDDQYVKDKAEEMYTNAVDKSMGKDKYIEKYSKRLDNADKDQEKPAKQARWNRLDPPY